jgi:UDP-N-acetylglucosamine--N-acetylmuramyl-(pentapeptide) pyrophosphoryl-undecaprenol N-acetylglucosamine transferase
MKILLTGGGTGGHFYPLIAVAQEINNLVKEEKLLPATIYFMSDSPYDTEALLQNNIIFIQNSAGKVRRYFSLLNVLDFFKTGWGLVSSCIKIFNLFPDVIFSKGGYASFPVLFAARLFKIPVIIHESDSVPGKTNLWAGKFAKKIAVSYPETAEFFNRTKVAYTGNPIRKDILQPSLREKGVEYFHLENSIKTILVLGGSLGAQKINDQILGVLPKLLEKYNVIHQTGKKNIEEILQTVGVILENSEYKKRYKPQDYMDDLSLSMAAGASDLVISRAGSTIFEISSWGVPSIIIPITDSNGDHQRKNAFSYARSGGAVVIEEINLSPNVLLSEINRLLSDEELLKKMKIGAKSFIKTDASRTIAKEILEIGLKHEK